MGGNQSLFCGSRDILTKVESERGPGRFATQIFKPHRVAVLCSHHNHHKNDTSQPTSKTKSIQKHNNSSIEQTRKLALLPVTCPMCCETFDDSTHAPCTLPCGHSICHHHTKDVTKCPVCKTKFLEEEVARAISLGEVALAIANTVTQLADADGSGNEEKGNDDVAPSMLTHVSECPICWETFNEKSCVPCTIPTCGHSFCLKHVRKLKSCPICRDPFPDETKWEKSIALSNASIMLQSICSSSE
mmetsp:Transcript_19770/g.23732  ORF Transcript_19770/g.23732 Transcript_19770/m.23732 type:complete len:245 (+) Transcript_19770:108-842(+)